MDIQIIPIHQIHPAKYNPRKDLKPSDPEYQKLKKSIHAFGFIEPLVWNRRTGNLVGGHQRFKVLVAEGVTEVPCSVVDLDEDKEKALNIALNKISGDWELPKLKDLLEELELSDLDMELTGFDSNEIEELMAAFYDEKPFNPKQPDDFKEYDEHLETEHQCPRCGYEW